MKRLQALSAGGLGGTEIGLGDLRVSAAVDVRNSHIRT